MSSVMAFGLRISFTRRAEGICVSFPLGRRRTKYLHDEDGFLVESIISVEEGGEIEVGDIQVDSEMKASIYKSQLNYVDSESYTVYVHDNRMVLFSDQSETSAAVGLIEK
jgi:hypothetical protein